MSVSVDGERVLHVRHLRWKFRGSEKVDLGGGDRVQVSWDLHNWLFASREPSPADATAAAPPPAHALFVFRFELGEGGAEELDSAEAKEKELLDKAGRDGGVWAGYLGRWGRGDWSESSSNGGKPEKEGAGAQTGEGEFLLVGISGVVLLVVGERLDRHGLGQPRGGRAAARGWLLASCVRLEELVMG